MARSTLSALMALASLTLVAGQSTTPAPTQTAAAGIPTFPATPLISEIFPYSAVVHNCTDNSSAFLY